MLGARTGLVLHLHWRSGHVRLMGSLLLLGIGLRSDTTRTAIEAGPQHSASHHRPAVHIADMRGADVHYGSVVEEMAAVPVATLKAVATKPKAVIDPAVEADMRSPVAGVPEISTSAPAPVARRPQKPRRRRQHPRAGHPVIARRSPGPVSRRP